MLKFFTPFRHSKDIYSISIEFFKKNEIQYVISDLDNTLDPFDALEPSKEAIQLKQSLAESDIELLVISNNKSNRVTEYCEKLGIRYLSDAYKPFKRKLNKFLKSNGISKEKCIMIGDQTVTDICCGNRAKIRTILVDKLVERDQPTTKFNRFFDKRIRKKLIKKNLLKEVNEL